MLFRFPFFIFSFFIFLAVSTSVFAVITPTFIDEWGNEPVEFLNPLDSAYDSASDVYYALLSDGTVERYTPATGELLGQFSVSDGIETISSIDVHPTSKNIYVTSSAGIVKVYTPAGSLSTTYGSGTLSNPRGVAVASSGKFAVADDVLNKIFFFNASGGYVTEQVLNGEWQVEEASGVFYVAGGELSFLVRKYDLDGTPMATIDFSGAGYGSFYAMGLAIRSDGKIALGKNIRDESGIVIINADGTGLSYTTADSTNDVFVGVLTIEFNDTDQIILGNQSSGDGEVLFLDTDATTLLGYIPAEAQDRLSAPRGIARASDGTIYVSDNSLHAIKVFDANGTFIRTFGTSGSGDGELSGPRDIAIDASGDVYVADQGNNRIQVFSASGVFERKWSVTESGGYLGPTAITIYNDNVYVTGGSGSDQLVQVFSLTGTPLFTFGGYGSDQGQFFDATVLAHDSSGRIFVGDGQLLQISIFSSTGTFTSSFSSFGETPTSFNAIRGITTDPNDNFYITDSDLRKFFVFNEAGEFVSEFGTLGTAPGEFASPNGIVVSSEFIYVADTDQSRVQKFSYVDDVVYETPAPEPQPRRRSGSMVKKKEPQQGIPCTVSPFLTNLRRGMRSAEVLQVQQFLTKESFFIGPQTGYFGPITEAAVRAFQQHYASSILSPLGLTRPTGWWYPATRAQANRIVHSYCTTGAL